MKLLILLIIAFLVLVYVYTFIKIRKKRKQRTNTVIEFREKYLNKDAVNDALQSKSPDMNYKKYVTKYNSKIDYMEHDDVWFT